MKKREWLLLLFIVMVSVIKAQTTLIKITNDPQPDILNGNKMLPIKFDFAASYSGKKISFYLIDKASPENLITSFNFGTGSNDIQLNDKTNSFQININKKDSTIKEDFNNPHRKISSGKIYFVIDGDPKFHGPFNITSFRTNYQPGFLFYDALTLKALINAKADSLVWLKDSILKFYGIKNKTVLQQNKFLNDIFKDIYDNDGGVQGSFIEANFSNMLSNAGSSIGGINVTNFADGLAKFLVERMKEELSTAFFEKFKNDLSDPKYADLKILFPETGKTLMTIDQDIYQYSSYLNTLRQSFAKDMTNEYVNLQKLLEQQKYKDYFLRTRPELGSVLYSSLYIINQLSAGKQLC